MSRRQPPPRVRMFAGPNGSGKTTVQRDIAQQFSPYITWQFNPAVIAACNPRQLRLLGNHKQGAYD